MSALVRAETEIERSLVALQNALNEADPIGLDFNQRRLEAAITRWQTAYLDEKYVTAVEVEP